MAVTAKDRTSRSGSRRKRAPSVLEQLIAGCDADRVAVYFLDGRSLEGALLFNPIKRSGKLINVEQEFSIDFEPLDVKEIRILQARLPTGPIERMERDARERRLDRLDDEDADED